jgi:hypothetical protein
MKKKENNTKKKSWWENKPSWHQMQTNQKILKIYAILPPRLRIWQILMSLDDILQPFLGLH